MDSGASTPLPVTPFEDIDNSMADAAEDTSIQPRTASVTSENEGSDGIHRDSVYYFEDIIFLVRQLYPRARPGIYY